ncbi:MAG: PIG-L family deacetylase [Chloroherpetonaceae bacterium]|nr:PIG-L family deacetylase [Chloroherpetonaceae bacterium]MDW8438186.1 PIG-L family deacetylase [Chloroherpetonaceae bacterium]
MKSLILWLALPASLLAQDSSLVLMGLAAHPDDEDGATLAYYAKLKGAKVYSLVFTRGEGGQNEIGSSLYDDLAEIRTAETLEAAKLLGAQTCFLNFRDFGYSKTATETFKAWGGKDEVLARLVYYIRKLRPDVIITNHDTLTSKPFRQHGHHQAVGVCAYEAFEKAADPNFRPEQLRAGASTWQPKKLFFRLFRPDDSSHPLWRDSLVEINVSAKLDSARTILQLAEDALAKHRSQGMDKLSPSFSAWFSAPRRFLLARSDKSYPFVKDDLFGGIEPSLRAPISLDDLAEPPAPLFAMKVYPSALRKAVASEAELVKEKSPKFSRSIFLLLQNRSGEILPVSLTVSLDGKPIFRKPYLFSGLQLSEIRDSIALSIEKDSRFAPSELIVEAKPLGVVAETKNLLPVSRRVWLKPVQAERKANLLVGLVKTYDSTLEEFFSAFEIPFALLDSNKLANENLRRYSAIVLDLRAYGYRSDLVRCNARILDYAKQGGNVICFYHKPQDWNDKVDLAPYPIFLTQERVAEEDAPVKLLLPSHPIFNFPNKITDADWQGWIQERSLYLPSAETDKTSPRYLRLLAMSDSGEVQPSTSLLWAKVGKGTYTYCSLALYRQLRILNEGATKLLFNLLSQ